MSYNKFIRNIVGSKFKPLLEAVLNESYISDWESNSKWGIDENGKHIGSKDITIDVADYVNATLPGSSISKSGYVFLPMTFALSRSAGNVVLKHISSAIRSDGKVILSAYPGYGVDIDEYKGAYPASMVSKLPADAKREVEDQLGNGWIIYAVNGEMLSDLVKIPAGMAKFDTKEAHDNPLQTFLNSLLSKTKTTDVDAPEWLIEILQEIVKVAANNPNIKAYISGIHPRGFEDSLILSSESGDSVLVLTQEYSKAAYVFKKKIWMEQAGDLLEDKWDNIVDIKMKEFQKKYRGKVGIHGDIPEPDPSVNVMPKLALRKWLQQMETDYNIEQGYVLRRDYRKDSMINLVNSGVNYQDGLRMADRT